MSKQQEVRVKVMTSHLEDVVLPMGLTVDSVELKMGSATVEFPKFGLSLMDSAQVVAKVSPTSLADFLSTKAPSNVRFKGLKFGDGKIAVEASIRILVEVSAIAVCSLEIEDGTRLVVKLDSVEMMGVGAKSLVQGQIDGLNPLLETKDLPFQVVLDSVSVSPDWITLSGFVRP